MDILDELTEKFDLTLDEQLHDNADYVWALTSVHEFAEHMLSEEKATELENLTGDLALAVFRAASKAGMKLGARITAGLLKE